MNAPLRKPWTQREFFAWAATQEGRCEFDGFQPVAMTGGSANHNRITLNIHVALRSRLRGSPCSSIIGVRWDFDGSGTYPFTHEVDGAAAEVTLSTTHAYDRPGTYFVTSLVESHRHGDVSATARRIPNVASARVIVS